MSKVSNEITTNVEPKRNLNSNFYSGIFAILFGLVFITITPGQVDLYEGSDALSPRLIPYITLSLIVLCGIVLLLQGLLRPYQSTEFEEGKAEPETQSVRSLKDLLIFVAVCLIIILSAEKIGYTFVGIILMFSLFIYYKVRPLYKALIVSVIIPISIDILYRYLGIYLPLGFWESIIY